MTCFKKIIVPVDESLCATQGLNMAIECTQSQSPVAQLKIITVVDTSPSDYTPGEVAWVDMETIDRELRESGTAILKKAADKAAEAGLTADTELLEISTGRISKTILTAAQQWDADVIIMGTHGRRGLGHLLLGSTTEEVLHHSPIPVLVVPPGSIKA